MYIVGIDLSGPSNIESTVAVAFRVYKKYLSLGQVSHGASDEALFQLLQKLASQGEVVAGMDAPLSYNPGGGDRPGDADLRRTIIKHGLSAGSVMTPTATKMVYLTLRGVFLAWLFQSLPGNPVKIAEVHSGATLAFHGAPISEIKAVKQKEEARKALLQWLESQGLRGVNYTDNFSDHYVMACGSALGAWKWHRGESAWLHPAEFPFHPFDFAC